MRERLVIHGGASRPDSIGQSCTTVDVRVKGAMRRVMIDCGMEFQREEEVGEVDPTADLSLLDDGKRRIDVLFLDHFHTDHVGGTAWLESQGLLSPEAIIAGSPQTCAILPIVLDDGMKQQGALFTAFDAARALNRCAAIPHPGEFELLPGLKVFIPQMGHAPGNAGIVIPTASGKKGLFTSDVSWHDQPVTGGALLPSEGWPSEWIPDEIWGTDFTYGADFKRKPIEEEVSRLITQVKIALGRGKKIVIAAFGNGRGQNVAAWLSRAGIPVQMDGITRKIYRILQETRWSDRDGKLPKIGKESGIFCIESAAQREELIRSPGPWVVITTGGMGNFGPVIRYMEELLPDQNTCFFFTSYLSPGTNGLKLVRMSNRVKKGDRQLFIVNRDGYGTNFPVRASVDHFSLGAHGDMDEFVYFIADLVACRNGTRCSRLKGDDANKFVDFVASEVASNDWHPLDRIILTHGTHETKVKAAIRLQPFAREVVHGERNTVIPLE